MRLGNSLSWFVIKIWKFYVQWEFRARFINELWEFTEALLWLCFGLKSVYGQLLFLTDVKFDSCQIKLGFSCKLQARFTNKLYMNFTLAQEVFITNSHFSTDLTIKNLTYLNITKQNWIIIQQHIKKNMNVLPQSK